MPNIRVIPPANGPYSITLSGNRTLTTTAGNPLDVDAADAYVMAANGWLICGTNGVGTTAQRPAGPTKGMRFTDTTVGAEIVYDGAAWRHKVTGGVA